MSDSYTQHPVSAAWPVLSKNEFRALCESVERNGCTTPIQSDSEGRIYDGWHRYLACRHVGVEPEIVVTDREPIVIAQLADDYHKGRRHLGVKGIHRASVRAWHAAGIEFAPEGRPRKKPDHDDQVSRGVTNINPTSVVGTTGVGSEAHARRTIQEVKREKGLLPKAPKKTTPKRPRQKAPPSLAALTTPPEPAAPATPPPDPEPDVDPRDDLIAELNDKVESLEERIAIMDDAMTAGPEETTSLIAAANAARDRHKAAMDDWMRKAGRYQATAQRLRDKLQACEAENERLQERVAIMSGA